MRLKLKAKKRRLQKEPRYHVGGHVLSERSESGRFQEGAARELQAGLTGAVDEDLVHLHRLIEENTVLPEISRLGD